MRHSMKPDLRADYKIRLYTGPQNPFFEVSKFIHAAHVVAAICLLDQYEAEAFAVMR